MLQTKTRRRSVWMNIAVVILFTTFAIMAWRVAQDFLTLERGMVINRLDTEASRLAITMFFAKMTTLGQLAVALLGGIWAFLTLTDPGVKVRGWPALTCFGLANASLALSLIAYAYGYDFLVSRMFYHRTFDIDAPLVAFVQTSQQNFFLYGVVASAFTIFTGRYAS
jgi:hypothetical protein